MENANSETETKIVNNIELYDLDGNNKIVIPVTYTKADNTWPFNKQDVPNYELIEECVHL